jgi:TRAP-type mannitol/chloroaromatic compound transport system permease small subunit
MTRSALSSGNASETVARNGAADLVLRFFALSIVVVAFAFLLNDYLTYWRGWPGFLHFIAQMGWFGSEPPRKPLDGGAITLGWIQLFIYIAPVAAVLIWVVSTPGRTLTAESENLTRLSAYIARFAFWAVLLIGLTDSVISFLRVENFLDGIVGQHLGQELGRANFRGPYLHYPLMVLALIIAYFTRAPGFIWLALLVVVAEFQIVIFRFIFSYEQAFMADLVRFWYAGLFLFASAYTLLHEGHVRVDILYTGFSPRGKAWTNTIGSLLLGTPVCWVILTRGMWGKTNVINSPLLNYEVTQSVFGLYVKYLMAGFLVIFAITMLIQFMSYFLSSAAVLLHEADSHPAVAEEEKHFG